MEVSDIPFLILSSAFSLTFSTSSLSYPFTSFSDVMTMKAWECIPRVCRRDIVLERPESNAPVFPVTSLCFRMRERRWKKEWVVEEERGKRR